MSPVGPSHFPEMLQPIPKLWANESCSFPTHELLLQKVRRETERYTRRKRGRKRDCFGGRAIVRTCRAAQEEKAGEKLVLGNEVVTEGRERLKR